MAIGWYGVMVLWWQGEMVKRRLTVLTTLTDFGQYRPIFTIFNDVDHFDQFGPILWPTLADFFTSLDCIWPMSTNFDRFDQIWLILTDFDGFRPSCWLICYQFWPISTILTISTDFDHLDRFWPTLPILTGFDRFWLILTDFLPINLSSGCWDMTGMPKVQCISRSGRCVVTLGGMEKKHDGWTDGRTEDGGRNSRL